MIFVLLFSSLYEVRYVFCDNMQVKQVILSRHILLIRISVYLDLHVCIFHVQN